jgi:hypothetical protein
VSVLPPELIRKGRFDELFFVDLPNQAEREQVFAIQLTRRNRNPADFNLVQSAGAAPGYSGAEIEAADQTALYAAFSSKQPLATHTILDAISRTVPLSVTRPKKSRICAPGRNRGLSLRHWRKLSLQMFLPDAACAGLFIRQSYLCLICPSYDLRLCVRPGRPQDSLLPLTISAHRSYAIPQW